MSRRSININGALSLQERIRENTPKNKSQNKVLAEICYHSPALNDAETIYHSQEYVHRDN